LLNNKIEKINLAEESAFKKAVEQKERERKQKNSYKIFFKKESETKPDCKGFNKYHFY